jgi:ABC-type branched-subunit amino acid transport system substrate-binding protein
MDGGSMTARIVALLVCAALVAGACGSRVDDDEAADAQDEQVDGSPDGTGTDGPDTTGGSGEPMFGDLPAPCGPGDASGATDQGVTDESIKVGVIADPGSVVPGLNQELHDGMVAFAGWCNDLGGINGREVEVVLYDAKLSQYRERVLEACDEVFALVGGGGVFDNLGAQEAVDCNLLEVPGFNVSPEKWETGSTSGLMYAPMPNPSDGYKVGAAQWIASEFPDVIEHGANTYGNAPVVDVQAANHEEAYGQFGFEFVYHAVTPLGGTVSDYSQYVTAMRDAGVEYFTFTSTWEELANFQRAMEQQGWRPTVTDLEANFYNRDYAASGESAEGSFVRIGIVPFEEADQNPATQQYLDAIEDYTDGGKVATLGVHSFSAGLLFAQAAQATGTDLTRENVIAELQAIHEWTGGGLHGTNDPGTNTPGPCFIVMEVQDGAFVRRYPLPEDAAYVADGANRGFACPDVGFVELDG